jgi:hypothetical protein
MLKPDVIVTQPLHCDFPLFRYQLHIYRKYYNKIIVVFHEGHVGYNYKDFFTRVLSADDVICVDPPATSHETDWRHNCIHAALPHVISENILFLEQDFIMYDNFEKCLLTLTETTNTIIGEVLSSDRLHPAFLFVPRYLVTDQSNFASDVHVHPNAPTHDHFGAFTEAILNSDVPFKDLTEIAEPESWLHLSGLTNNYYILATGGIINYNPEEFKKYNERILQLEIEMEPKFLELIKKGANLQT